MLQYLRRYRWLTLILTAYLALGVAYSFAVPLGESPDESDHFLYTQYISRFRRLPVLDPVMENNYTLEAHQPPLYYLVGAALVGWIEMDEGDNLVENTCFSFDAADPGRKNRFLHQAMEQAPIQGVYLAFRLLRAFSLLLGAGTILLAYRLARQAAPRRPEVAWTTAALLGFNPQFIFITASVNNDALTTILGAAIVAVSVTAVTRPRTATYALLGVLLGLGALAKFALFALCPVALLAAVRSAVSARVASGDLRSLRAVAIVALIPVAVAGWWFWWAHTLYGDPLVWNVTLAAKGEIVARIAPLAPVDLLEFAVVHFQSYWGWFGWLNVKPRLWFYAVPAVLVLVAAAGWLRLWRRRPFTVNGSALMLVLLAVTAVYLSLFRYIQTINWSGYQGRLAFAAAAPLALLLALGLVAWGRRTAAIAAGMTALLALVALFAVILPAYPRPTIYQPGNSADLGRACARFAGGWQLEAFHTGAAVKPGAALPVTLHGYGLATAAVPQTVVVEIIGRERQLIGRAETSLQWQAASTSQLQVEVPVAADAKPVRAVVRVGLLDGNGDWQPAASASQRILDPPVALTTVKVAPVTPVAAVPQHTAHANFDDQIALLGYDLNAANDSLALTLYWQALAPLAHDYTVFVHLLDSGGRLITQDDGQPVDGHYPTTIWEGGEVVADDRLLALPFGVTGPFRLAVGIYRLDNLARMPVYDASGDPQPGDQFFLPEN
jgi:4-amino-4-deoxy-L-arabinose transferase-like glycosyltransferase